VTPERNSGTIAQGYQFLTTGLAVPIQPSALVRGGWAGVIAEARREGVSSVPASPAPGSAAATDLASFQKAYNALLGAGKGKLDEAKLERAAMTSMAQAVNDCHTA